MDGYISPAFSVQRLSLASMACCRLYVPSHKLQNLCISSESQRFHRLSYVMPKIQTLWLHHLLHPLRQILLLTIYLGNKPMLSDLHGR